MNIEIASPYPKIEVLETEIQGCFQLRPPISTDQRGSFAKIYHRPLWEGLGLCTDFQEEYVTSSVPGTLRGLHFQRPPMQHHKVVVCLRGEVFDVAVDLRKDSPTYGHHTSIKLTGNLCNALYLPAGLAHGFCVTGDTDALLYYKQSSVYSPSHDSGIRWDTVSIAWPFDRLILSERDRSLGAFDDFDSPFRMDMGE